MLGAAGMKKVTQGIKGRTIRDVTDVEHAKMHTRVETQD